MIEKRGRNDYINMLVGVIFMLYGNIFGHSWGFLYGGRGRPWYGTSAQPESHFTCSSPRRAPRLVPSTLLLNCFWAFLGGLGRGEGALLVRYLCQTHRSLHGRHVC